MVLLSLANEYNGLPLAIQKRGGAGECLQVGKLAIDFQQAQPTAAFPKCTDKAAFSKSPEALVKMIFRPHSG